MTNRLCAARLALCLALPVTGCSGSPSATPGKTVVCPEPTTAAPDDVFCIGLYANGDATRYQPTAVPYTPGTVFWSDGAEKQRYLELPVATTIDTTDMDAWTFPVGTKAFKEFRFDGKLVETRMLWKQAETNWVTATYIWDETQTSAPLNTSTKAVLLPSGYEIPTAKNCGKCHHGGSDKLLGVEAIALALPSAKGQTLERLVAKGLLSNPPSQTKISLPEDETGMAAPALAFLHSNCGMACHSTRGLGEETQLVLRLRADEFWSADGTAAPPESVAATDPYKAAVDVDPSTASVAQAFPGAKRIVPGQHDQSLLWLLSHRRDQYQMPPLVSHVIDEPDSQALADWIDALH